MTPAKRRNGHRRRRFSGPRPVLIATSDQPSGGLEPAITDIPATDSPSRYVRR